MRSAGAFKLLFDKANRLSRLVGRTKKTYFAPLSARAPVFSRTRDKPLKFQANSAFSPLRKKHWHATCE
jgi:hypothetical protein